MEATLKKKMGSPHGVEGEPGKRKEQPTCSLRNSDYQGMLFFNYRKSREKENCRGRGLENTRQWETQNR